jgi:alpha-ketoglutarate-dependent 2,4-dichlorophenoxyacetate dioxygenase
MSIDVHPVRPSFVARVTGVDLAETMSADSSAAFRDAIDIYSVLIVSGQRLDDDHLLNLGKLFGDVEPPRSHRVVQRLKHAELADISNPDANNQLRARDDHRRLDSLGNRLWHSDASFHEAPGALSMLFAHVVPPVGGETEFADLRAAYEALDAETKARIEGLMV